MDTVEFDEVEGIFSNIWCSGYEDYFYRKAWDILEEKGLTSYDSDAGHVYVIIRAICLYMLFGEFSQAAFDESFCYDDLTDNIKSYDDCVDNFYFLIGQMYGKINKDGEVTEDLSDAAFELVNAERASVLDVLESGFAEYELVCVLFCVVAIDSVLEEPVEIMDQNGKVEEIEGETIDSYDDFWNMVEKHWLDFAGNPNKGLVRAYDWLSGGTYPLGCR